MATIREKLNAIKQQDGYIGGSLKMKYSNNEGCVYEYFCDDCGLARKRVVFYGYTYDHTKNLEDQIITSESGDVSDEEITVKPMPHNSYKAGDLTATPIEQEYDLEGEFTDWAISNSNDGVLGLKLNSDTGDVIRLEKQGFISHNNYILTKVFYQRDGETDTKFTVFATRRI